MQIAVHPQPPRILQIHRESLKPGSEVAYREIEEDTARLQVKLGCPHPYLAIESLSGSKEVWFFNGYDSAAEQKQMVDDYAQNTTLLTALKRNSARKASLTGEPVSVFAKYRQDLSAGAPWVLGRGRFLVITVTRGISPGHGTVFEAEDGTQFVVMAAETRREADAAAGANPQSKVFVVRPSWSFPSKEWIAADSRFWRPSLPAKPD